jgi:outer membrane protein
MAFHASAQNKIGYIATEELIGLMPEAETADAELKEYQSSLAMQGQDLMQELNEKDSLFVKDSAKYSPSMREIKKKELFDLYQKVQNWNQQAQELYQQKAQEKIAPLRTKAMDAIKAVAKESGYAYVLDNNAVLVGPPGDDILDLVKKKLGVKDAKPLPKKN